LAIPFERHGFSSPQVVAAFDGYKADMSSAEALAPYRTSNGGYRLENVSTYLIAYA
jgi:hypothetical protein